MCDIPGHPPGAHGGHPGCNLHGDMHYRDGFWYCWGFDGEGCKGGQPTIVIDQYYTGPQTLPESSG